MEQLARQVKLLKIYAAILTVAVLICLGFILKISTGHFDQITAQRINVTEADGKLRLVISNHDQQHPGIMDNKVLPKRDRPAGMIFFNDAGDECGGLVYDGNKQGASMTYSIDQYKNDQVMQLQYLQENNGGRLMRSYGLKLWDRSDQLTLTRLMAYSDSLKKLNDTGAYSAGINKLKNAGLLARQRLFVGKNADGEVGLFVNDAKGIPRLKIFVNRQNQPVIETLDEKGTVIASR